MDTSSVECHTTEVYSRYFFKFKDDKVKKIGRALGSNPNLLRLELWDVILSGNALEGIADCLMSSRTIYQVVLSGNSLGNEGIAMLAPSLKWNSWTGRLAIWRNGVGDRGTEALAGALKSASVCDLSLACNEIGDLGAKALSSLLGSDNRSLAKLDLNHNQVGCAGVAALFERIRSDHTIVTLGLAANPVGTIYGLQAGVKENSGLLDLHLWGNGFSREELGGIEEGLRSNRAWRNRACAALRKGSVELLSDLFDGWVSKASYDSNRESFLSLAVKVGSLEIVKEITSGRIGCHPVYREGLEIAKKQGAYGITQFLYGGVFPDSKKSEPYPFIEQLEELTSVIPFHAKVPIIESRLGYTFHDKRLLVEAFTHPSYAKKHPNFPDNDRLEWRGDSVLRYLLSESLFADRELRVRDLSEMRANAERNIACAAYVGQLELGEFLLVGEGYKVTPKAYADLFEALLGAIVEDSKGDLKEARRLLFDRLAISFFNAKLKNVSDAQERLLSACRYAQESIPDYKVEERSFPETGKFFDASVWIRHECWGEGYGRTREEAMDRAAEKSLKKFREHDFDRLHGIPMIDVAKSTPPSNAN